MKPSLLASPPDHALASDLVKLCLPQAQKDPNRRLAWANSICLLFLVIGTVGLKPPKASLRRPAPTADIVPVVITTPPEPPKPEAAEQPRNLEPPDAPAADPPVAAVVVALDVSSVAFAVPVEGPVVLAPVRSAAPPPRTNEAPAKAPKPTQYLPSEEDWGGRQLEYPPLALRRGYHGKVVLEIVVDPSGAVSSVKVAESSGYRILDDAALEHVRKHLRLRRPPGETRLHTIDIIFQLKP